MLPASRTNRPLPFMLFVLKQRYAAISLSTCDSAFIRATFSSPTLREFIC
jgi:hypothetical protein